MANLSAFTEAQTTLLIDIDVENTTTAATEIVAGGPRTTRPPDYQGLILGTTLVILIIVANFVSLVAFVIEKRLRTYNNYFIINLTIADLFVGLLQIIGVTHTFIGYFPFNQTICRIYIGLRNANFSVSVVGVVIICIDRHRATYDPINHFMTRSKAKAMKLNALTWLISYGFWMPFTTGWDYAVDHDAGRHCVGAFSRSTIGNITQNIISFFIPLVIISVLYLRIFLKIKETIGGKSVKKQFDNPEGSIGADGLSTSNATIVSELTSDDVIEMKTNPIAAPEVKTTGQAGSRIGKVSANDKGRNHKRESSNEMQKATRTLSYIVISFIIAWLPNNIIYLLFAIDPRLILTPILPRALRQFFNWLRYANSFLNPLCYVASQPLFRQTIINMFCNPRQYC
ncbi:muscarinic acetylcholine receptor M2-like [Lytechinus pictus]|uniref:muscarinic acetylcholine receptor M2-like n=1 Tax=Lytechinus pictus TaxID=7653 RepID=UPI0030B9D104